MELSTSGIYSIRARATGKVYVGSATRIYRRWQAHQDQLDKGKHANQQLQALYNEYGPDDLDYRIILRCGQDQLLNNEKRIIRELEGRGIINVNFTGSRRRALRLTEDQLADMLGRYRNGESSKVLAKEYGISQSTVTYWAKRERSRL